ncbi:hypothetical protein C5167_046150, partial [Papaver somniferum]
MGSAGGTGNGIEWFLRCAGLDGATEGGIAAKDVVDSGASETAVGNGMVKRQRLWILSVADNSLQIAVVIMVVRLWIVLGRDGANAVEDTSRKAELKMNLHAVWWCC